MFLGTKGKKITVEVTMFKIVEFKDYKFSYYGTTTYIYIMKDADDNTLVWKTTSFMHTESYDEDGNPVEFYAVKKGDKLSITGTVKDHSIYNDVEQTVLNRVKFTILEKSLTYEEIVELKQKEQLATLQKDDFRDVQAAAIAAFRGDTETTVEVAPSKKKEEQNNP